MSKYSENFLKKISISQMATLPSHKLSTFRTVRDLEGAGSGIYSGFPMLGKTLEHLGIFHNDVLIVKMTKNFNEENLYLWNTPKGRAVRFARMSCAEIVLHNGGDFTETFSRSAVEMLGVIVRIERDLTVKR